MPNVSVHNELPNQLIKQADNEEEREQKGQHRNQMAELMNKPFSQCFQGVMDPPVIL